jgi:hypothetical protein
MSLDLSLPFLTFPLEEKNERGGLIKPALKVNINTLAILSVLTVLSTLVLPRLWKEKQKSFEFPVDLHHYNQEHKSNI